MDDRLDTSEVRGLSIVVERLVQSCQGCPKVYTVGLKWVEQIANDEIGLGRSTDT